MDIITDSLSPKGYQSPMFQFKIGPHAKIFYAHSDLVAGCSSVLKSEIYGDFSEAKTRTATIEDVEGDTFPRFLDYVYTGSYEAAKYSLRPQAELRQQKVESLRRRCPFCNYDFGIPQNNGVLYCGSCHRTINFKNPRHPTSKLWEEFTALKWDVKESVFQPQENTNNNEDYTPIFLSHAQLYVFADKYLISNLKNLTLTRLQRTLVDFNLWEECIRDVTKLARYIFANTPDGQDENDMRSLITHYIACYIEKFADDEDFQSSLEENSTLGRDLVLVLKRRIGQRRE